MLMWNSNNLRIGWATAFLVLVSLFLFSSCQKREVAPVPPSEKGVITCVMLLYDGETYTQTTCLKSVVENNIGRVSGLGSYQLNERVVIQAEVKSEDYILHSLYEQEGKAGLTKEKGVIDVTASDGAYNKVKDTMCQITFHIKSDMMFIAIFTKKGVVNPDLPPLPPIDGPIIIGSVDMRPSEIVGDTINVNANEFN